MRIAILQVDEKLGAKLPKTNALPVAFRCKPRCLFLGLAWLAVGFVLYMIARPPTAIAFLPHAPNLVALVPSGLRALLGPMPTFIHVLAFSLLSASIVGSSQNRRMLICGAWCAINILFEAAQYKPVSNWLLSRTAPGVSSPYVRDFLIYGTFDPVDLLAAILGAAFAGWILTTKTR